MDPVLPIIDVEYDASIEVTGDISNFTAEQYLSWVRHQANRLPLVVTAREKV